MHGGVALVQQEEHDADDVGEAAELYPHHHVRALHEGATRDVWHTAEAQEDIHQEDELPIPRRSPLGNHVLDDDAERHDAPIGTHDGEDAVSYFHGFGMPATHDEDRCVGARYQEIDRAMVDQSEKPSEVRDSEHRVIKRRPRKHRQHGRHEQGHGHPGLEVAQPNDEAMHAAPSLHAHQGARAVCHRVQHLHENKVPFEVHTARRVATVAPGDHGLLDQSHALRREAATLQVQRSEESGVLDDLRQGHVRQVSVLAKDIISKHQPVDARLGHSAAEQPDARARDLAVHELELGDPRATRQRKCQDRGARVLQRLA
mmetsp:Transcript_22792/g.65705  ORF Transcript_22792/g.65705 Transcript_22792/m.65705 type:complete len:316 (-) Transcript_22792:745-1692(-)